MRLHNRNRPRRLDADPHDLARFVRAQAGDPKVGLGSYASALAEVRAGLKRGHWMWYVFPRWFSDNTQTSQMSRHYAIKSVAEAEAYLAHPILGPRLRAVAEAALSVKRRGAAEIFGAVDAAKLQQCADLFAFLSREGSVFHRLLARFFPEV